MLLGRGPERAAIDGLIRGASQGVSGALLLSGDPGAGKSALLKYAGETARGMTVVRARGIEAESSLPFAALADVLRPMIGQIDRLPAVQSASLSAALAIGPPLPGDRFTTYLAALNLVALFAETQPVLIIVDDMQWIDPGSAEALFYAARRLSAERVAILFAARTTADLPADPAAVPPLQLGGLDRDASLQLVTRSTPAIATSVADAIYRASRGNPRGLIEFDGSLAFRHPLIRSAVYEAATADERRNAHRLLAESLPTDAAARRTWHRAEACLGPDEAVASELEALAGEQQARRAYAAAFHAFNRAAELSPAVPDRVRRLTEAATSALLAGRGAAAVAQYDRALTLVAEPVAHADLVLHRGQIAIWVSNPMEVQRTIVAQADRIAQVDPKRAALLLIHAAGPRFIGRGVLVGKGPTGPR